MIKIFNHYFHRRTVFQVMIYSLLIVITLIISLAMQAGAGFFSIKAISAGMGRGLLMVVGIVAVNFSLGLYERPRKINSSQMRARAVLSFICSMGIAFGILELFPLLPPYDNEPVLNALFIVIGSVLVVRFFGGDVLPATYSRQRVLIFGTGSRAKIVGQ